MPYKTASRINRRSVGYLGVQADGDSDVKGAYVAKVVDDSPAEKAGIKIGDVIKKVDGKDVESATLFVAAVQKKRPGQKVKITVERDKKELVIEVALGNAPGR